jgi:hypothetical protein
MSTEDPFIGGRDAALRNRITQQQKEILELKAANANLEAALAAAPAHPAKGKRALNDDKKAAAVAAPSATATFELKAEVEKLRGEVTSLRAEHALALREREEAVSQLEVVAVEAAEQQLAAKTLLRNALRELELERAQVQKLTQQNREFVAAASTAVPKTAVMSQTAPRDDERVRGLIADIRERLSAFEQRRPARLAAAPVFAPPLAVATPTSAQPSDAVSQPGTCASTIEESLVNTQKESRKRPKDQNSIVGVKSTASTERMPQPTKKMRTEKKPVVDLSHPSFQNSASATTVLRPPAPAALHQPHSVHFGEDPIADFIILNKSVSAPHDSSRLCAQLLKHVGGKGNAADMVLRHITTVRYAAVSNVSLSLFRLSQELNSLDIFSEVVSTALWRWAAACQPEAAVINHHQQWELIGTLLRHWSHRRGEAGALQVILYDAIIIFLRNWHTTEKEDNATTHQLLALLRGLFANDELSTHKARPHGTAMSATSRRDVPCSQVAARFILSQLVAAEAKRNSGLMLIYRNVCDGLGWPWHAVPRTLQCLLAVMAERYVSAQVVADIASDILHGMRLLIGYGGFELLETVRAAWAKPEVAQVNSAATDKGFAKLVAMLILDFHVSDLADPNAAPYFKLLKDFLITVRRPSTREQSKSLVLTEIEPDHIFVAQVLLVVGTSAPTTLEKVELLEHVGRWAKAHEAGTLLMEQNRLPRVSSGNWTSVVRERQAQLGVPLMQVIVASANSILR